MRSIGSLRRGRRGEWWGDCAERHNVYYKSQVKMSDQAYLNQLSRLQSGKREAGGGRPALRILADVRLIG